MTKLKAAIALCGFFEVELLASLMLRYWQHPRADDHEFVNHLIETAADVLVQSRAGTQFFEEISPEDMNFVAAFWYAEACQLSDIPEPDTEQRREWLGKVRRALPSCFCDPDELYES